MEKKEIILSGISVPYFLRKSKKARWVRIDIRDGGDVVLTVPQRLSERVGENFLRKKTKWVFGHLERIKNTTSRPAKKYTRADYLRYKEKARMLIHGRLEYFNNFYGFKYNRVSVKDHKTLWGSCSPKGNLNFNYKVLFLPSDMRDYIVVHELCHLKEANHSVRFWALVARIIPNHVDIRKKLRKDSIELSLF